MARSVTHARLDRLFREAGKIKAMQEGSAPPSDPDPLALLVEMVDLLKEINERLSNLELALGE